MHSATIPDVIIHSILALALEMTHHTLTERAAHHSLCVLEYILSAHISICLYLPP